MGKARQKPLTPEEADQLYIQRARTDFASYCYYVDPKYSDSARHLSLLHKKLMRIEAGLSLRDQTFMPPQHGKTHTATILFTAWYLGRNPDHNIIFATYAQDYAAKRGSDIRDVMQSAAHLAVFPNCVITQDTNAKDEFKLVGGGSLLALGRKGGGNGRNADGIILDDLIFGQTDADSAAGRLEVKNFYTGIVVSRCVNTTWIHIINTRWHEDDLSGWTLTEHEHENWNVLALTAICEDEASDPTHRKLGEALWPEKQSLDLLLGKKKTYSPRQWSAVFQQEPVPAGGTTFKTEHLKRKDEVAAPGEVPYFVVQSYDTAQKIESKNDFTVCTTWELYNRGPYLRHTLRKRVLATELQTLVYEHAGMHKPNLILVEDKSSGTQLVQALKGDGKLPILAINPTLNKELRFDLAAMVLASRSVAIPAEGANEWITDYRSELARVPASKFDDQADSTSQFLLWYDEWIRNRSAVNIIIKSGKPRFSEQLTGF